MRLCPLSAYWPNTVRDGALWVKKGLSLDEGRADFSKKTRRNVSFKKGISNEPTLGLIHLAGQYL
jgi:hypothetical protein